MSDIFTENLPLQTLEKHGKEFYGDDECHYKRYKENAGTTKELTSAAIDVGDNAIKAHAYYKEIFGTLIDAS